MKRSLFFLGFFALTVVANSFFIVDVNADVEVSIVEVPEAFYEEIIEDTSVPAKVAILEYHNFDEEDGRWTRSPESFYNDLLWLYNNDYRPVTVGQYLDMDFPIEKGKRPVVITFDDSSKGQFRMLENGSIDPDCAVGVMNKFAQDYPDFGRAATFFILPYSFAQPEYIDDKLKYLVENGYEIGSHTYGG